MIAIDRHEAHLWYVLADRLDDADLHTRYQALLSGAERERYCRSANEQRRHEFLVTRALCRTTLSRYADVDPADWSFAANRYGRPEISAPGDVPQLRFNLSHSAGVIACVVTLDVDAGVDVEDIHRGTDIVRVARRYFSPLERAALRTLPADRQRQRFFEYWTLKEAYIKARGSGLSIPLNQFSLHLDDGMPITISFASQLHDDPHAWQFARYRPSDRHTMALALHRGSAPDMRIVVSDTVPLQ